MNNRFACAFLALLLLLQPVAMTQPQQGSRQELFDNKKSSRDLEVMKGILRTTLSFVTQELREPQRPDRYSYAFGEYYSPSSISAYYLVGQGAVFTIPASSLSRSFGAYGDANEYYVQALSRELGVKQEELAKQAVEMQVMAEKVAAEANAAALAGLSAAQARAVPPPPPPSPPAPSTPPQPKAQASGSGVGTGVGTGTAGVPGSAGAGIPGGLVGGVSSGVAAGAANEEKARQKLAQMQEKMKKQQESLDQRRAKFRELMVQIKAALAEALANHGDSLSQVKANEYITVIISEDNRMLEQSQVLSVQKSAIADYKAGRISMEAFRAKVLDYSTEE